MAGVLLAEGSKSPSARTQGELEMRRSICPQGGGQGIGVNFSLFVSFLVLGSCLKPSRELNAGTNIMAKGVQGFAPGMEEKVADGEQFHPCMDALPARPPDAACYMTAFGMCLCFCALRVSSTCFACVYVQSLFHLAGLWSHFPSWKTSMVGSLL